MPKSNSSLILHHLCRDRDLQRAIKLSEEEEAKRAKAVEDANSKSLFEDGPTQTAYVVPQSETNPLIPPPTALQRTRTLSHL